MSKRVLSLCLALAVLLLALPIMPFGNMDAKAAGNSSVAPTYSFSNWPSTVPEKVVATFDEEDAQVGHTNYWRENGADQYAPQYKGYVYAGAATVFTEAIVDGEYRVDFSKYDANATPSINVFMDPAKNQIPTVNTKMLKFHIDTTGMDSESIGPTTGVRFMLAESNGSSGTTNRAYVVDNKTWYFQPDATEENPNPEMEIKNTGNANGNSMWNSFLYLPNGVKGTVYLPVDAFYLTETSKINNYRLTYTHWDSTLGANVTDYDRAFDREAWEHFLTNIATSWKHQNSITLNIRDNIGEGDWIAVDGFEWLMDFPVNYQLQAVTQDFSNFRNSFNWQWMWGTHGSYGNTNSGATSSAIGTNYQVAPPEIDTTGGKFAVTPNDSDPTLARISNVIYGVGNWNGAKAFSFDLDISELSDISSRWIRISFGGNMTDNNWANSSSFHAQAGTIYFVADDGTVTVSTTSASSNKNTTRKLPSKFKGKVIIPRESIVWYDGNENYKDLDTAFDNNTFTCEISWDPADNGVATYYIDNLTYYTDIEGPEAGYNFATDKVGYESNGVISSTINTVEAWVKTTATAAGTIFSDKYTYPSKNYADGYESFQIAMNAAGNPVVYLSAGDCTAQFVDWTIDSITLNDGKWNHIAVAVDQEAKAVKFYLNGVEVASKAFEAFDGVEMARPIVLGHTINNSASVQDWFDGEIAKVAVFGDARNAGEVMLDAIGTIDTTDENLLAFWELNGTIDATLKAYDQKVTPEDEKYDEYVKDITDGSYTIAFLPDTQIVNRSYSDDVTEFDYFNNIYTWIIDNAEDYNIKAVLGLGDITDTNDTQTSDKWKHVNYEWENARNAFDRLSVAGIPWAIVQGNHDYNSLGARHANKFQEYFPMSVYDAAKWDESTFKLGGAFYPDEYGYTPDNQADLSSAYYYLNVDADADYEYMVLALEFEVGIGTLEWARQVVQKNSDKKVIIITHGYMDPNGTRIHRTSNGLYHDALNYTGGATGEDLWNHLASQYANIEMVVCGHLSCPDIITRVDKGVNGNEVLQVLMDAQGLDASPECPVGMVGLATYNADGTMVSFKYVATRDYRTDSEAEGKGAYFYDDNSNELEFTLGSVTAPYVDKSVDNSAKIEADGLFDGGVVIRDFEDSFTTGNLWWGTSNGKGDKFEYSGRKTNNITVSDFDTIPYKWEAGRIHRAPVAQGNTVSFKGLPNFTPINGETVQAISIHLENPASVAQYFRISLGVPYMSAHNLEVRNYDNNYAMSTKIYLVADNGTVTVGGNSTWATTVPANFSGTMIIPLSNNYCQWGGTKGSGNYIWTAEDFRTEEAGNQVTLQFNAQGASCETNSIYFDNIAYHTNLGDAYSAPLLDKNGNVINFVDVKDGATLNESDIPAAPDKFGMKFVGWANVDVPGAAIYPIYEKTSDRFTISATEGTVTYAAGQDYALFNDRIVVQAPATNAEGEAFAYWTANGDIFSYSNRISFLAFGNANFVPVYGDVEETPIVFTDSVATIVAGTNAGTYKMQVMGAVQVPEDVTVKEIGILLSASAMDAAQMKAGYEANDGTVKKLVASNAVAGKQFTYGINNIAAGKTRTALTYAILSDGTVVYGNTTCVATMPSAN